MLVELEDISKVELSEVNLKKDEISDLDDIKLSLFEKFRRSKKTLVTVVWIAIFVDCLFYSIVIPLLPLYLEELHVSQSLIGVLYSSFSFAILASAPFAPSVVDKIGCKNAMLGGMFVLESSSILFAFGTSYWVLLIARMLQGFSSGVTWCAGFAMIANAFPSEQQGTIIGYITVGNGLGMLLGPIIGGALYSLGNGSKEFPFLIMGIPIIIDGVARALIRDPPQKTVPEDNKQGYIVMMKDMRIMMVLGITVFGQGALASLEPVLPVYLESQWGLNSSYIGLIIGAMLLVFAACSPVVGKFCDRCPQYRNHIMALGLLLMVCLVPLMAITSSLTVMIILLLGFGAALSCVSTPPSPEINSIIERDYESKYFSAAAAALYIGYGVGAVVGPIGVSALVDGFNTSAGMLGLAIAILIYFVVFVTGMVISKRKYAVRPIRLPE